MKIFVKTLKGTHFEIEVKPEDNVADVKKNIESVQGQDVYPAAQQMLIHQGKVLKDTTTLEENKVAENSFVVIMLSKNKVSSTGTSSIPAAPSNMAQPAGSTDQARQTITAPQATAAPPQSASESAPTPAPVPAAASSVTDVYDQAASNLVAGSNLETTVQQILDMGGGSWDRDTVVRALRAAYNNPERAVDYLYSFLVSSKLSRHLINRMGLFGRKFKASKVTTVANLAISRISILKKQHQVRCSLALSDVTQLLHLGRQEDALHRVELVIKEQNIVDALAMMEKYCHLLIEKKVLIKTKGECPEEVAEAISSLIFAASRWGEFPELHELREIFTSRYGNEFAAQCVELRNDCSVQPKMIPKLSKRHTGSGKRRDMLNDIAADCGITLCIEDETSKISRPEVNSENECAKGEEGS